MKNSFSLAMSLLGILGCFLNIYLVPECWLVWIVGAVGFSYYFLFKKKDYGAATLWVFYVFFDIFGFIKWKGWI